MSKLKNEGRSVSALDKGSESQKTQRGVRKSLLALGGVVVVALFTTGIFAKNGWFPSTDAFTGKKTGWFGKQLPKNASSSWNPLAAPSPTPTPQLAKEYIYAGSRLLAVEDANANAAPPADLAVWRPSDGGWWVMGGQGSQQVTQNWGTNGDDPVEGDYDGDGKTDFSVFRVSTNTWYLIYSSTGTTAGFGFGSSGDIPAQADYDGDGKTDAALFRPSTGDWYIIQSSNGQTIIPHFGASGDTPAPADYDGDGRADIAVWRNSVKTFYSINSSNSATQIISISQPGTPVSSDYDGDGKADYAVYDSTNANWHIRQSTTGQVLPAIQWGLANDKPVQNDYDGEQRECSVSDDHHSDCRSDAGIHGCSKLLVRFAQPVERRDGERHTDRRIGIGIVEAGVQLRPIRQSELRDRNGTDDDARIMPDGGVQSFDKSVEQQAHIDRLHIRRLRQHDPRRTGSEVHIRCREQADEGRNRQR